MTKERKTLFLIRICCRNCWIYLYQYLFFFRFIQYIVNWSSCKVMPVLFNTWSNQASDFKIWDNDHRLLSECPTGSLVTKECIKNFLIQFSLRTKSSSLEFINSECFTKSGERQGRTHSNARKWSVSGVDFKIQVSITKAVIRHPRDRESESRSLFKRGKSVARSPNSADRGAQSNTKINTNFNTIDHVLSSFNSHAARAYGC